MAIIPLFKIAQMSHNNKKSWPILQKAVTPRNLLEVLY
jgi:hypothetical protein